MNARERVIGALSRTSNQPPWIELSVHPQVFSALAGEPVDERCKSGYFWFFDADGGTKEYERTLAIIAHCSLAINLDAIGCKYWSPALPELKYGPGIPTITEITEAFRKAKQRVDSDRYYTCGGKMLDVTCINRLAGYFAIHFLMHPLIDGCLQLDRFCCALYDKPAVIRYLSAVYTEYTITHIRNLLRLKPDFLWVGDDLAYKQGPYISPNMWCDFFMPFYEQIAREITCPWIYHSDGNILPMLDYLIPLGMKAIHPLEPGALDICSVKKRYGKKIVLVGNLDMYTIQHGTRHEVERQVEWLYKKIGHDDGWILSSSNSIDRTAIPANVKSMGETLARLRTP